MHVIHTSVLVFRINVLDGQSRKSRTLHSSLFLSSISSFAYMRVPEFARISGDFPATNRNILIRRIFQQDKSNRTNWTRKCSYIFLYRRLRNRFRITPNRDKLCVSTLFTCLPGFPSPRLNKPASPFFRSVNTTT